MTTNMQDCFFPEFAPLTGYNKGCRCDRCVTGKVAYGAEYRRKNQRKIYRRQKARRAERIANGEKLW